MKTTVLNLIHASFLFKTINGDEYEVRIEKRSDGVKDFNIFLNGNYKTTYPLKYNANQSNAKDVLDIYFKGLPEITN